MSRTENNPWLHRFAVFTALAALCLIGVGGLVTSHGAGMAVPDWPTTYGYKMFEFPVSQWVGGVFYEHTHRLVASGVGLLTTILAVWLWRSESRAWLRWLGVIAFFGVVFQGVLGGLRVVWFKDEIGIFHAALAQLFLVLVSAVALFTSRWWQGFSRSALQSGSSSSSSFVLDSVPVEHEDEGRGRKVAALRRLFLATTLVIFGQLIIAATMRHQHAGLAIPDFPLAYGKVWPDMNANAIARYNQQRVEVDAANPITAFQVGLQMAHRLVAVAILGLVGCCARAAQQRLGWGEPATKLATVWLALICAQVGLGAWTIWSNKAADIATAHAVVGAVSLVVGALLSIVVFRNGAASSVAKLKAARFQPSAISPTPAASLS